MVEQPSISFGQLLRQVRIDAGLTQEELADAASLSARSVSDLERGVSLTARKHTARLLADALGLAGQARAGFEAAARGRVLADEFPAKGLAAAKRTLPRDIDSFTGRDVELAQMLGAAGLGGIIGIYTIGGMPGVGKTALAVHVGHLVADRFPDRQLFVDLHGHTPGQQPARPADTLAVLLAADGVDPRYLPSDLDGRAAMWRDRTADKRILLILDNAASSDQVTPLLPGTAECLVLITSRRYLGDLPVSVADVPLDTLPPSEALRMFLNLAPRAAEPGKVARLVALCGHLPLAISLLARLLTRHQSWTMDDLISETTARLLTGSAENRTVAAAFELSYQHLTTRQQRFFRRLGLHLGTVIDPYAAAALTGMPENQAARDLDALHGDRLLAESVPGRYRMHDLIRQYARSLAAGDSEDEREQAVGRLLVYYQNTAEAADVHLARHTRPTGHWPVSAPAAAPDLPGREQALAWMATERSNLIACIDHAAARHEHAWVVGLLSRHVDAGTIPGGVALLGAGDVEVVTAGVASVGGGLMGADAIMRIQSMTKAITSVAALRLVEAGRLELDQSLVDWLPELADRQVLRHPAAELGDTLPARGVAEVLANRGLDDEAAVTMLAFMHLAARGVPAAALSSALVELARNPGQQELVAAAAAAWDGGGEPPAVLGWAIDETLRLWPPTWMAERVTESDAECGSWTIPAGSMIVLPFWVIHRVAAGAAPETFDLTRWQDYTPPPGSYAPYGGVPRWCLGARFAHAEMIAILAAVLRRARLTVRGEVRANARRTLTPEGFEFILEPR
jgi:transcriptional regulator with XRE-family HTH domain